MIKSAYLPAAIEPTRFWTPSAHAGLIVDARMASASGMTFRSFVCVGVIAQGQVNDLQRPLVELLEKVIVKCPLAFRSIGLLQPLCKRGAAAHGHPEAANGPQEELYIPLNEPVVGIGHFCSAVNSGVMDGGLTVLPLNSNGEGLGSIF